MTNDFVIRGNCSVSRIGVTTCDEKVKSISWSGFRADAEVSFRPKNRPMAVGKTDADGRFVLNTFRKGDGSFFGACQVTVGPFVEGTDQPPAPTSRSPTEDPRPDIPLIYRSPATTPLTAEVVAGKKNVVDFKLD